MRRRIQPRATRTAGSSAICCFVMARSATSRSGTSPTSGCSGIHSSPATGRPTRPRRTRRCSPVVTTSCTSGAGRAGTWARALLHRQRRRRLPRAGRVHPRGRRRVSRERPHGTLARRGCVSPLSTDPRRASMGETRRLQNDRSRRLEQADAQPLAGLRRQRAAATGAMQRSGMSRDLVSRIWLPDTR